MKKFRKNVCGKANLKYTDIYLTEKNWLKCTKYTQKYFIYLIKYFKINYNKMQGIPHVKFLNELK